METYTTIEQYKTIPIGSMITIYYKTQISDKIYETYGMCGITSDDKIDIWKIMLKYSFNLNDIVKIEVEQWQIMKGKYSLLF